MVRRTKKGTPMSCFMLRTIHSLAVVGILALGLTPMARAQDMDGITVHCVDVTVLDPRFLSCQDQHMTIQAAVNHAESGETVLVGMGVFPEQVTIDKPLTLEGAGASMTSIEPLTVSANTSSLFSGAPIAAILLVDGTPGVAVSDLTIDGMAAAFNACSPGNGGPGLNSNVAILQNMVDDYGKNGITANEPGTFVTVNSNTVMGRGPTGPGDAAQNGVQIGFGARGLVSGNTISMHDYVPPDFVACGLLFFRAGGGLGRAKSNTFVANEQNICTAGVGPSPNSPFN